MAGDRLAALIDQVAFGGLFDFARSDPRNPASGHRLARAVAEQIRRNRATLLAHDYRKWVAVLSGAIGSDGLKPPFEQCDYYRGKLADALVPGWGRKQTREEKIRDARSAWERVEGRMDDPKTQARIAATARWLAANTRNK